MSLNAIIMAGGEGTRLRPLTCDTPKPMVPVLGRPVMAYALQLLHRHSLTDVGVTLQYLPEKISRYFGSGAKHGVSLHYTRERTPLGTAGGVLAATKGRNAPRDTFVVLSGDGLTDCDLTEAMRFHKQKKALVTLVLTRVRDPLSYGVVIADDHGRVQRFVEKPGWGEVYSDTINTGIYLLEPEVLQSIWEDKPCDFGRDLFPQLVRDQKDVYAYCSDSYWCDIGDQAAYVRAQADFLSGRINLDAGAFIAETAQVDETATIEGPVYIGPGARVMAHARLSDCAIVGMNATVGTNARVSRSVLWEDVSVGHGAQVRGAVLCRAAQVLPGGTVLEESALGDGAVLGARASLEMGAKVWPGKRIDPCLRVTENIVWDGAIRPTLAGGTVDVPDPQTACLLAASFAEATEAKSIAIGHDGSAQALSLYAAVQSALLAQGVSVVLVDECMMPVFRCAQRMTNTAYGVHASAGRITITQQYGGMPDRGLERKMESLFVRQDYARPYARTALLPKAVLDSAGLYIGALSATMAHHALAKGPPHVAVFVTTQAQETLVTRLLAAVGLSGRVSQGEPSVELWETGFVLASTGESVIAFDAQGMPSEAEQTLLCYAAMPEGHVWTAPMDATAMLEPLAQTMGATFSRVSAVRETFASALLKSGTQAFDMQFDGLYRMLMICRLLSTRGTTLRGLLASMPTLHRHTERVPVPLPDRGRLLRAIAEEERDAQLAGGLRIARDGGWLTVNPDERMAEMVIVGESTNMEAAKELCGEIVKKLTKKRKK